MMYFKYDLVEGERNEQILRIQWGNRWAWDIPLPYHQTGVKSLIADLRHLADGLERTEANRRAEEISKDA